MAKLIVNYIMEAPQKEAAEFVKNGCEHDWDAKTKFGVDLSPEQRKFYMEYIRNPPYYDGNVLCRMFVRLPSEKRDDLMSKYGRPEFPRLMYNAVFKSFQTGEYSKLFDPEDVRQFLRELIEDGAQQNVFGPG